jgi:hypothetical protein
MKTEPINISAITPSNIAAGTYALYGDNRLYLSDTQNTRLIAEFFNIKKIEDDTDSRQEGRELEIVIHFHHPYVCVTERFGCNASLVNIETGTVRELKREPYHADVSSYSIGFIEQDDRTLLIHQTAWNRLDILDIATGENLTEREIICRETDVKNEDGNTKYEYRNYLDFFHSRIQVSPEGEYFLSNGWVWGPQDRIAIFSLRKFLQLYELSAIFMDQPFCNGGYNWDRPCCFIDDNTFAVVLDDAQKTDELEPEDEANYEYKQLAFYKITDEYIVQGRWDWLSPYECVKCDAFHTNEEGEAIGKLYYDKAKGYFVAVTPNGSFAVN